MDMKHNNDELQSRRQFFKKAANNALPILGFIALTQVPFIAHTRKSHQENGLYFAGINSSNRNSSCEDCSSSCTTSCYSTCKGDCDSGCKDTCDGGCKGRCEKLCTGCIGTCSNACYGCRGMMMFF